ncbi:outer membrane protein OmpA-like peptidoglycan-associated protein [Variovorax boronicumulans]|uniref:OmpA family protein n=1 Tax=Variovorax boronicumulans TaxID=436515 RepID=UPI002783D657|nr:OmpA family protein [Variovorax boronicumulans]MDQ0086116.1 outer membrane protein OmpA-like peptidoglycan-associated protein [Variovorax boronicumulans]
MSINLLKLTKRALDDEWVRRASLNFNAAPVQIQFILDTLAPSMVASMLDKASTVEGARILHAAVMAPTVDGHVGLDLAGRFDQPAAIADLLHRGEDHATVLLGANADALVDAVSAQGKASPETVRSLISIVASVLFGLLKGYLTSHNGQRHALVATLGQQVSSVQVSQHAGYWSALGLGPVATFFTGIGDRLKAVMAAFKGDFSTEQATADSGGRGTARRGVGLWWLIAMALFLVLLWWAYVTRVQEPGVSEQSAARASQPAAPAAVAPPTTRESMLSLTTDKNGQANVQATVATDGSKQALLDELKKVYGENVQADIKVDAKSAPANWIAKLGVVLPLFKMSDAELSIKGSDVQVGGNAADAKLDMVGKVKAALGETFNISAFSLSEAMAGARKVFSDGLAALTPGACSSSDVVKVMNSYSINFPTGAFELPKDDLDALARSASAVKDCAQLAKLEIVGHTDNIGSEQSNLELSQRRAEVVRSYLISQGLDAKLLTAKGAGSIHPVGDNDTPRGRFQNRRIEIVELDPAK